MLDINVLQQKTSSELLDIIKLQQDKLAAQQAKIHSQETLITQLSDALTLSRHRQFGKRSEREVVDGQFSIFNEAEAEIAKTKSAEEVESDTIDVPAHKRKKHNRKLPSNIPRTEIVYDLDDNDKHCQCGNTLSCIGDERSEQIDIIPAKVNVIVHVRKKYACQDCKQTIKQAAMPKQPIPKSIATPGTLAHILVSKFQDALPLYRQEAIYQRCGIEIPRSTLSNWVIRCGDLLKPLVNLLQSNILDYDIAFADETRVQVLREPGREAEKQSYMWMFAGGSPDKFSYVYRYNASRAHDIPLAFLQDFDGYLHADGFSAYDTVAHKSKIKLVGCWYHVRRKFVEAAKVSKQDGLAKHAIKIIKQLSDIERDIKNSKASSEKAKAIRQLRAKPIIEKFRLWLEQKINTVPPSFPIGKAIAYTLKQWSKLITYLEDGRLHISNNLSERAIKPFVIGRKNWLFNTSVDGADASAIIYSLIETCKAHDIQPYDYLRYVLAKIPHATTCDEFEALLPFHCKDQF